MKRPNTLRLLWCFLVSSLLGACQTTESTAAGVAASCKQPVIMVVSGVTLDRKRMAAYAKAIAESGLYVDTHGYYLNNPIPVEVFEGTIPKNHATLMVRFPSLDAARSFWQSPIYQQDIKPLRLNPSAGDYTVVVYKESELPDYIRPSVTPSIYASAVSGCQ